METITITRKSKVGYGINIGISHGEQYPTEPTKPDWTGTLKSVKEQLDGDAYLNSLVNTYSAGAWFVQVNRTWRKIINWTEIGWQLDSLYAKAHDRFGDGHYGYCVDMVDVQVADLTPTQAAAAALGHSQSPSKTVAAQANGRKGGRPRKNKSNEPQ